MMDSNFQRLFAAAINLLRHWWQVDRIRVSPREGQLLRLRPPCLLEVCSQPVEVRQRSVGQTQRGPYVVYHCVGEQGPCELWITPVGARYGPRLRWIASGGERELSVDDVQVYG